jgi:hypothetical protein
MPETSVYRCADCGHGKHLMAWAPANVYGPLGPDGELAEDTDVWTDGIHEDSIQCCEHPSAIIEHWAGGEWCRWWRCPWCWGDGKHCPYEGFRPAGGTRTGAHEGLRPAREIKRLPALPGAAPGHVFKMSTGMPARNATCRICTVFVTSITGGRPCEGDRHECPAEVPEGTPGSTRVGGHEGWFCYQPGKMNAEFTAWACEAGHVITEEDHAHPGGQCVIPGRCPWPDLVF